MERVRKCKTCGKELDYFEGCQIPVYFPPSVSFPMPSGGVELYCEKCYKDAIGETVLEEQLKISKTGKNLFAKLHYLRKKEPKTIIPINDTKVGTNTTIIGIIDSNIEHKEIIKNDQTLRMSFCDIKDDTGKITLILWDDMINKVENKKVYKVKGYIQEFNGRKQITLGYNGKIEELNI